MKEKDKNQDSGAADRNLVAAHGRAAMARVAEIDRIASESRAALNAWVAEQNRQMDEMERALDDKASSIDVEVAEPLDELAVVPASEDAEIQAVLAKADALLATHLRKPPVSP